MLIQPAQDEIYILSQLGHDLQDVSVLWRGTGHCAATPKQLKRGLQSMSQHKTVLLRGMDSTPQAQLFYRQRQGLRRLALQHTQHGVTPQTAHSIEAYSAKRTGLSQLVTKMAENLKYRSSWVLLLVYKESGSTRLWINTSST